MLRIYCLQQWYSLPNPAMEEALYEIASIRRFAGIDLDRVPDETTMLNFRQPSVSTRQATGRAAWLPSNPPYPSDALVPPDASRV